MLLSTGSLQRAGSLARGVPYLLVLIRSYALLSITALAAALSALSPNASAQKLSIGVVSGGSLTESFQTQTVPTGSTSLPFLRFYSPSRDYIVGAQMELRFRAHFSVEADGLYRKLHFTTAGVEANGSLNSVSPSPVITWEFPVLVKYRFEWSKVSPFVDLGPSFRTAGNLNGTNPSHHGITVGAGIEMHTGGLNITPTLRYTRWAADGVSASRPNSNPDQVEVLVGFSRGSEMKAHPLGRRFSVGVILGTALTDGFRPTTFNFVATTGDSFSYSTYPVKSFIVGPAIEFELIKRLSIEADAIYRPLRSETVGTRNGVRGDVARGGIATWEIPVLAKYTLPVRFLKPFVQGGPSFRPPAGGVSNYGVSAGAGVEARLRMLKIAPAVRYTHWVAPGSSGAIPNQVELLISFSL